MHYFAFGSNLDPEQMARRCPNHRVVGVAALHDHKLVFPLYSESWEGGVASVSTSHGNTVWGVVLDLTDEDLAALDGYEGYLGVANEHNVYDREPIYVDLVRPDDGSVPRRVRAFIYLARPANPSRPSRRYVDAIIRGARHHRLPEDYILLLTRLPVLEESPPPA